MTETREPTRIVLFVETSDGAPERLAAALAAADVASVVIRAAGRGTLDAGRVRLLVTAVQAKGAAALIESDARLARTLRADGVHLPVSTAGAAALAEAREIVGTGAIAGLDAGRSRHEAMTAGEAGADYIGFGIPDFVRDRAKAVARRLDLVAWWAELFEMPCIAFDVATAEEAAGLAAAGADFVAVTLRAGVSAAEAAGLVRDIAAAVRCVAPEAA